jgi:DNA-binding IclR family transcriptional regulator
VSSDHPPDEWVNSPPVRTTDRLIAVVESFLTRPTQTLSQVAAASGMELPTATRYLRQLVAHGWLERDDETRTYSLGVRMVEIGKAARTAHPLRQAVLPYMQDLLSRFDETVNLAIHQSGEVVIIEALESRRSIRRGATVGERDGWFVSSLGKSILAHLPEDQVLDLLAAHPPRRLTEHTFVTKEAILADLADVRARGFALDDEESEIGLKCVGVPLRDYHGRVTHALSISGPTERMNARLDEITTAVTELSKSFGAKFEQDVS